MPPAPRVWTREAGGLGVYDAESAWFGGFADEVIADFMDTLGSIVCEKECYVLARTRKTQRRKFGWRIPLSEEMQNDAQQDAILRWMNQVEAKEILAELVNQMTPLEQSVYEQYYVQDRTAHETAALLHMKVNAVNDAARWIRKKALRISRSLLECFLLVWFL